MRGYSLVTSETLAWDTLFVLLSSLIAAWIQSPIPGKK